MNESDRKIVRALKSIGDELDDSPGYVLFQAADRIADLSEDLSAARADIASLRDEIEYLMNRRMK